jgi:outer membrane protein assembly factor BamB
VRRLGCAIALVTVIAWSSASAGAAGNPTVTKVWDVRSPVTFGRFLPETGHFVVADHRAVYVASGLTDQGQVVALDRRTGRARWRASSAGRGGALIQASGDGVVVVNSYEEIDGLDTATGQLRWSVSLPALGLAGYWPGRSAMAGDNILVGLSGHGEGDFRPPIVLALDVQTGRQVWSSTLAPGTDLNFSTPAVRGSVAVFMSTLSAPGTASGNMVHALDTSSGSIRWHVELGGEQAFGFWPAQQDDTTVFILGVRGVDELRAVDVVTGAQRWSTPGRIALRNLAGLWVLRPDHSLALVDPDTGAFRGPSTAISLSGAPSGVASPQLFDVGSGAVAVFTGGTLSVVDREGMVRGTPRTVPLMIDQPTQVGRRFYVATSVNRIVSYATRVPAPAR